MSIKEKVSTSFVKWQEKRSERKESRRRIEIANGLYDPKKLGILEDQIGQTIVCATWVDHTKRIPPFDGKRITHAVWLTTPFRTSDGQVVNWVIGRNGLASPIGILWLDGLPQIAIRRDDSFSDFSLLEEQEILVHDANNLPLGTKGAIIKKRFSNDLTEYNWCLKFPHSIHDSEYPSVWRRFLIKDINLSPPHLLSGSRTPGHRPFQGALATTAMGQRLPFAMAINP